MSSDAVARLTPEQKLTNAIREYAEATAGTGAPIVTEFLAVMFVEHFNGPGDDDSYIVASSEHTSDHALYGLAQKLSMKMARRLTANN